MKTKSIWDVIVEAVEHDRPIMISPGEAKQIYVVINERDDQIEYLNFHLRRIKRIVLEELISYGRIYDRSPLIGDNEGK